MTSQVQHPVLRYSAYTISALLVAGSVLLSVRINSHSVAWLLGFHVAWMCLLLAWRRSTGSPLHRAFILYLATMALYLLAVWNLHINVPGDDAAAALARADWILLFLNPGAICVASAHLRFTRILSGLKSRFLVWVEAASWAGSAYFLVLHYSGAFVVKYFWTGQCWIPTLDGGYGQFFYFTLACQFTGILIPFAALFTDLESRHRLRLIYYMIAAGPLWAACCVNFLISLGWRLYPLGGFVFLFHMAVLSYALLVQRVFDIRVKLRRGLAYAMVSVMLGAAYGVLLVVLPRTGLIEGAQDALAGAMMVALAGLTFAPLVNHFQTMLDRVFFRDVPDRRRLVDAFSRDASATVDPIEIVRRLCVALEGVLRPRRIEAYLRSDAGTQLLYAAQEQAFKPAGWPLTEALFPELERAVDEAEGAARVKLSVPASADANEAAGAPAKPLQFSEGDDGLAVPLEHGGVRIGVLLLYPRRADEAYTEDDARLAETLAATAATALQNARSSAQLAFLRGLTEQAFNRLAAGVLLVAQDGRVLQHNPAALALAGGDDFKSLAELRALQPELADAVERTLSTRASQLNVELILRGTPARTVLLRCESIGHLADSAVFLTLMNDITAYKELEETASRKEALARMGEMIASINHEIKNILQPTRYQVEKLKQSAISDPVFQHAMRIIPERLAALDTMLLSLKNLSRPIELRTRPLPVTALLESAWSDVRTGSGAEPVRFSIEVGGGAEKVHADGQWMRQVFVNLMKNAVEALGGTDEPALELTARREGERVAIDVRDNGSGIPPQTLARLFEPFCTTKSQAGTGLGLSICRRIVEIHGGAITVTSEVDKGTCITVLLPASDSLTPPPNALPASPDVQLSLK
jgi:signal transduction histidine kinase